MARHGLVLCQHRATAYTDLLEAYLAQYPPILNHILVQILDLLVSGVSVINKISKTSVDSKKEDTDTPGIKKKVIAA